MDYCGCGERATGRCVRKNEFVCHLHQRSYAFLISYLLDQASGRQPPGQREGVLCRTCYVDAVNDSLPAVSSYLLEVEEGSLERIVLRIVETGGWVDSQNYAMFPIGPLVIAAAAGHHPAWLFDSSGSTMTALYATVAKSRSRTPPRLEVVRKQERTSTTWTGKTKVTRTVTPVGTLDAWTFPYREDNISGVLMVGPRGGNSLKGWMPVDNIITLDSFVSGGDFEQVKRAVQGTPAQGVHHDGPAKYAMVTALRNLLA